MAAGTWDGGMLAVSCPWCTGSPIFLPKDGISYSRDAIHYFSLHVDSDTQDRIKSMCQRIDAPRTTGGRKGAKPDIIFCGKSPHCLGSMMMSSASRVAMDVTSSPSVGMDVTPSDSVGMDVTPSDSVGPTAAMPVTDIPSASATAATEPTEMEITNGWCNICFKECPECAAPANPLNVVPQYLIRHLDVVNHLYGLEQNRPGVQPELCSVLQSVGTYQCNKRCQPSSHKRSVGETANIAFIHPG